MVNSGTITTTRIVDKSTSSAATVRNMQIPVHKDMFLQCMQLNYMYIEKNYTLTSPTYTHKTNNICSTDYTTVSGGMGNTGHSTYMIQNSQRNQNNQLEL